MASRNNKKWLLTSVLVLSIIASAHPAAINTTSTESPKSSDFKPEPSFRRTVNSSAPSTESPKPSDSKPEPSFRRTVKSSAPSTESPKPSDSKPDPSFRRTVKSSAPSTNWLVGDVKPKTWRMQGWPTQSKLPNYPPYAPTENPLEKPASKLVIYPPYPSTIIDPQDPPQTGDVVEQPSDGPVQAQIECPEKSGQQAYAHPEQCDQFYLCTNGTLTLERCQNGLLFKGGPGAVHNHCHYHWDVDCSVRHKEMVALSTESCEFQFGMYPEALQDGCSSKYIVCEFGRATMAECAPGLAYDPRTHRCNWPDEMLDLNCEPKNLLKFECPEGIPEDPVSARFWPYPRFALKGDCKRLITCVNGQPRLVTCDEGMVVDDSTLTCDEPELVPSCNHLVVQHQHHEEETIQNK